MSIEVSYYALVGLGGKLADAYNIFREVRTDTHQFLERLDPKNPDKWVRDKALGRYIFKGEPGAEPISELDAKRFVEARGGTLSPPRI